MQAAAQRVDLWKERDREIVDRDHRGKARRQRGRVVGRVKQIDPSRNGAQTKRIDEAMQPTRCRKSFELATERELFHPMVGRTAERVFVL